MTYTTQKLISNAFYLSNIVSRDFESVSGSQMEDGLYRLNGFLSAQAADLGHIPTYKVYRFNAVIGQEVYFIPYLVEIETLTFNLGDIRYSMLEASRQDYFGTGRIDNIDSLPYQWHMERAFEDGLDGSNIYVYYSPQQEYVFQLTGKFLIQNVVLNQDLSQFFEPFYLEYMLYKLAEYLCEFYSVPTPSNVAQKIRSYEQTMRDISPLDLSMKKMTCFNELGGFSYADVILGRGWRPTS